MKKLSQDIEYIKIPLSMCDEALGNPSDHCPCMSIAFTVPLKSWIDRVVSSQCVMEKVNSVR